MVGPPVGGTLAAIDWRLVFAINVPACLAMLILLARVQRSGTHRAPFDWIGQLLAVTALGALVGSLIQGAAIGYASPIILGGFALAVVAGALFVWSQARSAHPMMPLTIFRPPPVRLALALGFVFMIANFGTSFLLSLYLQQELGLGPLQAGFLFLLSPAFSITGNLLSGRATNRFGARLPIVLGMSSMALGVLAMAAVAPLRIPLLTTGTMILTGFGGAFAMPPSSGLVLAHVPPRLAGTASAVFNTFRQVGGAVAIAVFGALVAGPGHFLAGMQISLTATGLLLILVVAAAAITGLSDRSTPVTVPTPAGAD
jgi:DHA2 family methylenomycin A resistance protein-like MFS transporter